VTVVAKDPFASLQFAGWDQLVFGGDDSGEFDETDAGGGPGSATFFPVGGGPFNVNQNGGANLLALYGNHATSNLGKILANIGDILTNPGPISPVDPGPEDRLRLAILEGLLLQTRPAGGDTAGLQALAQAAPRMSLDDLNAALKSVQTTIALGNTTISALQAQIKARSSGK